MKQPGRFDSRIIGLVFVKEMIEGLRDYRSLVPMILLSFLMGPALTVLLPNLVERQVQHLVHDTYKVGYVERIAPVDSYLRGHEEFILSRLRQTPTEALSARQVDVVIEVPEVFSHLIGNVEDKVSFASAAPAVTLLYDGKAPKGSLAAARLKSVLSYYDERLVSERVKLAGIDIAKPEYVYAALATSTNRLWAASPFIQGMLILVLVFLAFMGVIYPALDAITGERERGTLELLLTTSVHRRDLFIGKLAAIAISSYAVVNSSLAGFYISQFLQSRSGADTSPLAVVLPLPCVILVSLMMLPLCVAMASAALALATFARTVQQAQGYMLPLMVLTTIPLTVMAVGDIHLDAVTALVPFLNSVLAMNDALSGRVEPLFMLLAASVSTAFAVAIVSVVAPVVEREDILFGIDDAPARRLEDGKFGRELFFLYSTIFLLMFYLSQALVVQHHIWGLALTQIFVVLTPGLFLALFWLKLPARTVLRLRAPVGGIFTLVGAALTAFLTVTVAAVLASFLTKLIPGSDIVSKLMADYMGLNSQPLWLLLLVLGVMPAVCEELLFRGVILSLMPRSFSQNRLIVTVGLLFGAFHMSLLRFLPTGILGCLLTFIALRSRSIFPCMVLHAAHNMLSVYFAVKLKEQIPANLVMLGGIALGIIGVVMLATATRIKPESAVAAHE